MRNDGEEREEGLGELEEAPVISQEGHPQSSFLGEWQDDDDDEERDTERQRQRQIEILLVPQSHLWVPAVS